MTKFKLYYKRLDINKYWGSSCCNQFIYCHIRGLLSIQWNEGKVQLKFGFDYIQTPLLANVNDYRLKSVSLIEQSFDCSRLPATLPVLLGYGHSVF